MAVNLKKVAQDLLCPEQDVRILALTTVVQLHMSSVEVPEDLASVWDALEKASQMEDADTVFLARKGLNHLQALMSQQAAADADPEEAPAAPLPAPPPLEREQVLERLARAGEDSHAVANCLADLARVGPTPEDAERVAPYLSSSEDRVRANAVEVVEATEDGDLVIRLLGPLLEDPNHRVRANVNKALGRLDHPEVLSILERMVRSGNLAEREAGVYAMSFLKGDDVFRLLLAVLEDPYEGIRLRAVKALGRLKDPRAIPALRKLLNDIDIDVCEEADRALRYISMESPQPDREGFHGEGEAPSERAGSASPEVLELQQRRATVLSEYGQRVFLLLRQGAIPDAGLRKPFYDVVKAQEFLHKQRERVAGGELLDFDADQTRRSIEATLRRALLELALGAIEAKVAVPGGDDLRAELQEIERQLQEAG